MDPWQIGAITLILSIGSSLWIGGKSSGRDSAALVTLNLEVSTLKKDFKEHNENTERHTSQELRTAQAEVLDQKFRNQEQRTESKFNEVLLRIEQLSKEVRAVDTKVDRALAVGSSLSNELHSELGKVNSTIATVMTEIKRGQSA